MKNYQYEVVALIVEQGPIGEVSYKEGSVFLPTLKEAKAKAEEFASNVAKDGGRIEKLKSGKVDSSEWRYGLKAYEKDYSDNHHRYEFRVHKSYYIG